jgi:hypothetical protein
MSVVTLFTICVLAVVFLFALHSELRSARERPPARIERISGRIHRGTEPRVHRPAQAITLVCSRSRLVVRPSQVSSSATFER